MLCFFCAMKLFVIFVSNQRIHTRDVAGSASSGIQVFHAQFHAPGMCNAAPCFAANGVTTAVLESRQELRMRVASAHDPESNQSRRDQLEGFLLQSFRPGER